MIQLAKNKLIKYISDCRLGSLLTNLCQISTRKSISNLAQEVQVHILSTRSLPQVSLQNAQSGWLIRQRHIDQLIQPSRSQQSLIQNLRSVSSTNKEDILLSTNTIHLSQQLVDNPVTSSSTITMSTTSLNSNRIQLIKEQHTWSSRSCLIENVPDICLRLTEPHRQQFRTFN